MSREESRLCQLDRRAMVRSEGEIAQSSILKRAHDANVRAREAGLQSRRAHDANAHASMSEVEREAQNLARSQRRRSRQVHWVHNPC